MNALLNCSDFWEKNKSMGSQIFCPDSRNYLQILGARRVTWSKFHIEKLQIWSDLWTSLLLWRCVRGACVLIHTSLCQETKTAEMMLKILGATLQNLVDRDTRRLGFLHPCATVSLAECNAIVFLFPEYIPGISCFLVNAESTECILCVHTCL